MSDKPAMPARAAGAQRGLGRGLAALMGDAPAAPAGGVVELAIDLLDPGAFQPRAPIDPASLADLTASIRSSGILQPLLARPGKGGRFEIIAGERRWRAAQAAGLHSVPALVRALDDAAAMAAGLVENLQREDLNAMEEAEGYRRLSGEFDMSQEALGAAVGKSRSHIANTLRLLQLPATVQAEVRGGALSAGHARALLAAADPAQAALVVIARGLSVRQTEALTSRKPGRARLQKDPDTIALERDLAARLGLKIDIGFNGRGGTLQIRYCNLEQLDGIVKLLMPE